MIERLRGAYYRHRFGAERAALIERVERAMAALPQTDETERWSAWVWSLPTEAWEGAVALRSAQAAFASQREQGVRLISRRVRLALCSPGSPEARDAEKAVEEFKAAIAELESVYRERRRRFHDLWGEPPSGD